MSQSSVIFTQFCLNKMNNSHITVKALSNICYTSILFTYCDGLVDPEALARHSEWEEKKTKTKEKLNSEELCKKSIKLFTEGLEFEINKSAKINDT